MTLLELLVVVAIMAVATAGVSMALRDAPGAQLEREAERLAALLESGRAASRASGVPVRWSPTPEGFVFDGAPAQSLPERWLDAGVQVQAMQPPEALVLGPEPVIGAQRVLLALRDAPGRSVSVASDGLRPFGVQAVVTPQVTP
jgi:general secretion pathway protein H